MFDPDNEAYLLRQMSRANVVLFLGAGFSTLARNRLNLPLPAGPALAEELWELLGYDEPYDAEPLGEVYQAILDSGVPHSEIRNLLEEQLLVKTVPGDYDALTLPYWYRIYTTNIDDLVPEIYTRAGTRRVEILAFPHDDITDRDQLLSTIQLIFLNGRLPCRPDEITFAPRQYARASISSQPLYEQFVRDYINRPVIFVGTRFNEPLFWQYLEVREERTRGISEQRPRSFLITQRISPTKRSQLTRLNAVGIEAETGDFLAWLKDSGPRLPSRVDTLRLSNPSLSEVVREAKELHVDETDLADFYLCFTPVPLDRSVSDRRSLYLLGAAPHWEDLFAGLDAPRSITTELFECVSEFLETQNQVWIGAILGSAGCGKSTILRRLGIRLAQDGRTVYLTNSEELPSPHQVRRALGTLSDRAVLLFDNAEVALTQLPDLIQAVEDLDRPPLLLIASRTNDFDRLTRKLPGYLDLREFNVPHLNRGEIDAIIEVLETNSLLGELRGLRHKQRVAVFERKAHRQILVAMREATTGRGFDIIIRDEYSRLVPEEAKPLYLCTALATDAGYRLKREEFVACSRVRPAETLHILSRNLRDIVIPSGPNDELLLLRHRVIAELVIDKLASRARLRDAYIRILTSLAPKVKGQHWRSRTSRFYRRIVNHKTIYRRFSRDIEEARAIYRALAPDFGEEAHFWLQFGSLELEGDGGDLELAENYLRSASSLAPDDGYISNALGHMLLRKASAASTKEEALELRDEGTELLLEKVEASQYKDEYAVHILCSQRYRWSKIWNYEDRAAHAEELASLRELARKGFEANRLSRRLKRLSELIERAYLETATKDEGERDISLDL